MTLATLNNATLLAHQSRGDHDGGPFFGFLLLLVAIGAGIAIYRAIRRRRHPELYGPEAWQRRHHHHATASAEAILAERFAKGELTADDYDAARTVLARQDAEPDGGRQ